MSDDRDFSQYQSAGSGGGGYLKFREYLERVMSDRRRSDELKILIKFFSGPVLDQVLEGKKLVEAIDIVKAMNHNQP